MDTISRHIQTEKAVDITLDILPELGPRFFVPRLAEKPQNPIIDSLEFRHETRPVELKVPPLDDILAVEDEIMQDLVEPLTESIWERAASRHHPLSSRITSWDTLNPSFDGAATLPPFLSQRSSKTFASVRYCVCPTFQDPSITVVDVSSRELFESLEMMLTGTSSSHHSWDPVTETFILSTIGKGNTGRLVISGMDHVVSGSLVERFLTIGTLLRRMEHLVSELRQSSIKAVPSFHAFTHSLSSVLKSISSSVSKTLQTSYREDINPDIHTLTSVWVACAPVEADLRDLASLCHRQPELSPSQYSPLPRTAPELLSSIYRRLETALDNHSSRTTAAIFAFMLTAASTDYFDQLSKSLGYGKRDLSTTSSLFPLDPHERPDIGILEDDAPEGNQDNSYIAGGDGRSFPSFFSPSLSQALLRARQSLKLLHAAQPGHPLLASSRSRRKIHWFWTEDVVESAWLDSQVFTSEALHERQSPERATFGVPASSLASSAQYKDEFQAFRLFDLEPGSHLQALAGVDKPTAISKFDVFIRTFPASLPSLTPTLSDLTDLVLAPLADHIDSLSSALVDTFLTLNPYLNFHNHLVLLRSYLLVTSQAFRSRLEHALFSDATEGTPTQTSARTMVFRRPCSSPSREHITSTPPDSWVIGLAPSLTDGDIWPPGGADLSYSLRTVIIDSLDIDYHGRQLSDQPTQQSGEDEQEGRKLAEEAEWRLGFAIRDLPVGSGRAKWLNPRTMEALDFLYMDYQPPGPLGVLIPPTTLSKYHRLFTFCLRLIRVDNVNRALFRMTLSTSEPLFPTLALSQKLFLHFRFVASSFVTALSSYVFDNAIRGIFDHFLSQLDRRGCDHDSNEGAKEFADVFELANYHSKIMDDILGACLLRSSQKAVGDLLRGVLEIILEFGILMGDRKRGAFEEYQAAGPLGDLFSKFKSKMKTLMKVLKTLVDKGASSSRVVLEDARFGSGPLPPAVEGTANLLGLLVRLDVSRWWTHDTAK